MTNKEKMLKDFAESDTYLAETLRADFHENYGKWCPLRASGDWKDRYCENMYECNHKIHKWLHDETLYDEL